MTNRVTPSAGEAHPFDVVVVGGGPAGAATAAHLALRGRSVLLVEGRCAGTPVGDHLPGVARAALAQLGAWQLFLETGPLPSTGVLSSWGGEEPVAKPGIMDPHGGGWHLDRDRFDELLRVRAGALGAARPSDCLVREVGLRQGVWRIGIAGPRLKARTARARWLVDATGRSAWLGRRLDDSPRVVDALHGFVRFSKRPVRGAHALVEARPDGWWYSAPLPGGRAVAMFMTDADPGAGRSWSRWWQGTRTRGRFSSGADLEPMRAWRATSQWTPLTSQRGPRARCGRTRRC